MADNKVYKKNGRYFEQDPQYDEQMKSEGYEDASPEESAVYLADQREAKPFDPNEQADVQDEALANEIEFATRAQNQEITREQALERARNVREIMGERPVYPEIDEGPTEQAGDTGLTILDSVLGGLVFGAPKLAVRKIADAIDPNSTFSTKEMERRAAANPALSFGVELGTGLLQGGVGAAKTALLKSLAMEAGEGAIKAGTKAAARTAVRTLAATDVAGKAGAALTRKVGQATLPVGTRAGTLIEATTDIEAAAAKRAAGTALTAAEREVLEVAEAARFTNAPLTTAAGTLTKAGEKSAAERATFLLEKRIAEQYEVAGYVPAMARVLAQAAVGAGAGAVKGVEAKEAERQAQSLSLSPSEQRAFLDDYGAAAWRGAKTGGYVGGGLGVVAPVASKLFGYGLGKVKDAAGFLAQKIIPRAGSLLTSNRPEVLRAAVIAGNELGDRSVMKEVREFARTLDYQYSGADSYLTHLRDLERTNFGLGSAGQAAGVGRATFPLTAQTRLPALLTAVRNKFMVRGEGNTYVYDPKKLYEAIKSSRMTPNANGGYDIVLPKEIMELQDEIARWESQLVQLENDYLRATAGGAGPMDLQGQFAAGFPTPPNVPLTPTDRTMGPLAATGFRVAPEAYESFGKAAILERRSGKLLESFGSDLATLGVPTFLATQAGADLTTAAGGVGLPVFVAAKLLVDPKAAISYSSNLQAALGFSKRATQDFSRWVVSPTRGRATAAEAVRKSTTAARNVFSSGPFALLPEQKDDELLTQPFSLRAAKQLYEIDKELIGRLSGPDAVGNIDSVFGSDYRKLEAVYPAGASDAPQITPKQVSFLNSKMPKTNGRAPSDRELYDYGLYSRYVRDPDAIYDDIVERNYVPSQALEVLKQVYPSRLYQIQGQLLDAMVQMKESGEVLDSKQQRIADSILGKGNTAGLTPAQIRSLQTSIQLPTGAAKEFSSRRPELEKQGTTLGK